MHWHIFLIIKVSFAPEHASAFSRHASTGASVVAPVCCGGKSALRRVQTSNNTCVGVESQSRWVQDRAQNPSRHQANSFTLLLTDCLLGINRDNLTSRISYLPYIPPLIFSILDIHCRLVCFISCQVSCAYFSVLFSFPLSLQTFLFLFFRIPFFVSFCSSPSCLPF